MRALLVVDIQPDTVKPRHAENLISTWNAIIEAHDPSLVAYIANLRPFARMPEVARFAEGLEVVSDNVFFKRVPNAFSNKKLDGWLKGKGVDAVTLIGIDGNWCIKATAIGAIENGFQTTILEDAIASSNDKAFRNKTMPKLRNRGVDFK